jgi:hypothetical protein
MYCNYCGYANPDDARYCSSCGETVRSSSSHSSPRHDSKALPDITLIRATVIAHDREHKFWSAEDVEAAR